LTLPENVRVEKDINYAGTRNPRQALDLVRPRSPRGGKPLPVIVIIHGGAFRAGDESIGLGEAADFARSGAWAGSPTARSGPESGTTRPARRRSSRA
jgi:acetyl esterase/lipase